MTHTVTSLVYPGMYPRILFSRSSLPQSWTTKSGRLYCFSRRL